MNTRFFTIVSCLAMLGFVSPVRSQTITLSQDAEISAITIGPYQPELWSAFGHSGIRVSDPSLGLDILYDWGRFDFDQANFYWNFARGYTMYSIGRAQYPRYLEFYSSQDRTITEQVFDLTHDEKQEFIELLELNYRPENQEYLYNYVFDNCATKIPEVVNQVLQDKVTYDYYFVENGKSVRDLMDDYLQYQPWGDFVIDIALAHPIDEEADGKLYQFLPDYVMFSFDRATLLRDSIQLPLIKETRVVYQQKEDDKDPGWFTPLNTFVLLFFVVGFITNRNFKTRHRTHWIDALLFGVVGLFGWWFVFLWFGTYHLSSYNWNLLWALPVYLPLIFFTGRTTMYPFLIRFFRFAAILHLLILIGWGLIPQPLHHALIPLILTMALRAFYISFDLDQKMRTIDRQAV